MTQWKKRRKIPGKLWSLTNPSQVTCMCYLSQLFQPNSHELRKNVISNQPLRMKPKRHLELERFSCRVRGIKCSFPIFLLSVFMYNFFIVSKNLQRVFMLKRLNIDFFQKTCFPLSNWKFKEQTFLTTDTIAAVKQEAHREFYSETKWSFLVLLITINLTPSYFKTSSKGRAYLGKKSGQGWILNIFCAEHVNTLVAHLNTKGRHLHSPELPQYRDN